MSKPICKAAKSLTEEQRNTIYEYIYNNSIGNEAERKDWTMGWYELCLANDNAIKDMLFFMQSQKDAVKNPTLIQDIIIHAGD